MCREYSKATNSNWDTVDSLFSPFRLSSFEPITVEIYKISMTDYENHHYDKDLLKSSATAFGSIKINPIADLEQVRKLIEKYTEETASCLKLSADWCFLDCKCASIRSKSPIR